MHVLNSLKKRERNLAHVALTMFVGSWLVLCMGMLQAADFSSLTYSKSEHPCHTTDNTTKKANSAGNHCLGACDCHVIAATLNSHENKDDSRKLQNIPLDAIAETIPVVHRTTSGFSKLALVPPERAILLPHHHYTVLLN